MHNKNHDKKFTTALKMMFSAEGGYSNLKNDYGGPTNLGITQTTFNRWRTMKNKATEDIRNITKDEAEKYIMKCTGKLQVLINKRIAMEQKFQGIIEANKNIEAGQTPRLEF